MIFKHPDDFIASSQTRWVNGMWFIALAYTLITTLLAILTKQWLEEYRTRMHAHAPSSRHWAWRHLVFNRGLMSYKPEMFVGILPALLHFPMFLFLFGLVIFLWDLDRVVAGIILWLASTTVLFYSLAMGLAHADPTAPTVNPIIHFLSYLVLQIYGFRWWLQHNGVYEAPKTQFEHDQLGFDAEHMDTEVIVAMISDVSAEEDIGVALQAIGSLNSQTRGTSHIQNRASGTRESEDRLTGPFEPPLAVSMVTKYLDRSVGNQFEPADVARWLRTTMVVSTPPPPLIWGTENGPEFQPREISSLADSSLDSCNEIVRAIGHNRCAVAPAILARNLLLALARNRHSLHFCTAVFSLMAPYIMIISADQRDLYVSAIDVLLHRVEKIAYADGAVSLSAISTLYNHMRHDRSSGLRALNIFGLLFSISPADAVRYGWTQPFGAALCAALVLAEPQQSKMLASELSSALAFVVTPAFAAYDWPDTCLAYLLRYISTGFIEYQQHSPLEQPNTSLRALYAALAQWARRDALRELSAKIHLRHTIEKLLLECGKPRQHASHVSFFKAASVVERATQCGVLGFIHPQCVGDTTVAEGKSSIWSLVFDITLSENGLGIARPLVHSILAQLCILRRSGVDVSKLVAQLLHGISRQGLIQLLVGHTFENGETPEQFLEAARHVREVSPEWWSVVSEEIRSQTEPAGQSANASFAVFAALVDQVEELGPCSDCPVSMILSLPCAAHTVQLPEPRRLISGSSESYV